MKGSQRARDRRSSGRAQQRRQWLIVGGVAVVVVAIIFVTLPLVYTQRKLLAAANRYVAVKGKASAQKPLAIGAWRWPAAPLIVAWLGFTVVIPVTALVLRSLT